MKKSGAKIASSPLPLRAYDVFNGDADGICALHQLRMAYPCDATLITGIKRNIDLLRDVPSSAEAEVTVLDVSLDSNIDALKRILDAGAQVTYVDHHSATQAFEHPQLRAYLDDSPVVCTSILVDRYLKGRYRQWAIVGAFGDNLIEVGQAMAREIGLSESDTTTLQELGFLLNYNAYGERVEDLHVAPEALYKALHPYSDPFAFVARAPEYTLLASAYRQDTTQLADLKPEWTGECGAIYVLPFSPWAGRISGVLANQLISGDPQKSFAVLSEKTDGSFLVSVRSGAPAKRSASGFCKRFATGGGRRGAAGINSLPARDLERFMASFLEYFSAHADPTSEIVHADKEDRLKNPLETTSIKPPHTISLMTLVWLFLRIACSSFGGYMAMISATQNIIVVRRKLLTDEDVLDGISLASVLPGPIALHVVAYVGYRLRGNLGALVAVYAAIAPAFLLILLLSIAYFRWGHIPAVGNIFLGVVPAVAAIILNAAASMWRKSITSWREGMLAVTATVVLLGLHGLPVTLVVIVSAAVAGLWWFGNDPSPFIVPLAEGVSPFPAQQNLVTPPAALASPRVDSSWPLLACVPGVALLTFLGPALLSKLFATFASLSLLLFGGAYVFVPVLQHAVVDGYGWVTQREFVDAVAMSQMMPGPVIVCAAFIGFKVFGLAGAMAATMGIVMPSTVVMLLCTRMLDRIKNSKLTMAALRGVRAAVVGMVIQAAVLIGKSATPNWISLVIFTAALIALVRYRVEAVWLVPIAGGVGFLLY